MGPRKLFPPLSEDQESSTQVSLRERSKKRTRGCAGKKRRRTENFKIEGSFVGAWPALCREQPSEEDPV